MAPKLPRVSRWIRPIAIAAALSLGGCSFMLSGPPADTPPHRFPQCDEDVTAPAIDASWAVLFALSGLAVAGEASNDGGGDGGSVLAVAAVSVALFGGAAFYGFSKTRRCGEVRDEYRARYQQQRQREPAPAPFGPPSALPTTPR